MSYWAGRARSELGARAGFEVVVADLRALGAAPEIRALADRALADETRHAEICLELARRHGGAAIEAPEPPPFEPPVYSGDERLDRILHVVSMCCINESLACAFLEGCLAEAGSAELAALQRRHLADEVNHARIGWALLASDAVGDGDRRAVAEWAPRLIAAQRDAWHRRIAELPAAGFPGRGLPPAETTAAIIDAAIRDLVIPGFAHVGIDLG